MRSLLFVFLLACGGGASQPRVVDNHVATAPAAPAPAPSAHRLLEFKVVDSDSPVSQAVFAHVGLDDHGVPRDAKAAAAGISGSIDSWEDEAGKRHIDYYLTGDRAALEAYLADAARQDPALAVPADRELGFESIANGKVRTYVLEREAGLDERAVQSATASLDPNTNRSIVLLELTRDGGRAFGALSERIVGRKLAILVKGRIKSAPIINGAITGGRASISMAGDDAAQQQREAEELAGALSKAAAH